MTNRKQKRKMIPAAAVILIVLCLLMGLGALLVRKKVIMVNPLFLPADAVIGVDLSSHQGDVDMTRLKEQGIHFAYIKATEGSTFVDARFAENWENASSADLPAGAYHFFSFDSGGSTQAMNFIETVGDLDGRLLPAVDVEFYGQKHADPPSREDVVRELGIFIDAVENEYHTKVLIYSSPTTYELYIRDAFKDNPKWIRSIYYPPGIWYHDDWAIWQYMDRGRLDGYEGSETFIDLDVLNADISLEDLKNGFI